MELKTGTVVYKVKRWADTPLLIRGVVMAATTATDIQVAWLATRHTKETIEREVETDLYPDAEAAVSAHLRKEEEALREQL